MNRAAIVRNLPTLLAVLIVVVAGLAHGDWTNRWGDSPELRHAGVSIPRIPKQIGPWVGEDVEDSDVQQAQYRSAELRAAVNRVYENRETGEKISLLAVCGVPGPIGTHTPESCYNGAGFLMAFEPETRAFPGTSPGGKPNMFWVDDFVSDNRAIPAGLKLYWSYRPCDPDEPWAAAVKPRADYASYRALYKVYVIRQMSGMDGQNRVEDNVTPGFIEQLLPAMEAVIFRSMKGGSGGGSGVASAGVSGSER